MICVGHLIVVDFTGRLQRDYVVSTESSDQVLTGTKVLCHTYRREAVGLEKKVEEHGLEIGQEKAGDNMIMQRLHDAGYDTHILDAEAFAAALDDSTDLNGRGMRFFDDLMIEKFQNIPPRLLDDLDLIGIEKPILVTVDEEGYWCIVDGHHRLAWALTERRQVPVLFVDEHVDTNEVWLIMDDIEYSDYA